MELQHWLGDDGDVLVCFPAACCKSGTPSCSTATGTRAASIMWAVKRFASDRVAAPAGRSRLHRRRDRSARVSRGSYGREQEQTGDRSRTRGRGSAHACAMSSADAATTDAGVAGFLEADHAGIDALLSASVVGDTFDLSVYGSLSGPPAAAHRNGGEDSPSVCPRRAAGMCCLPSRGSSSSITERWSRSSCRVRRPLKVSADPGAPSAATPVPAVVADGRPAGATRSG